YLVSTATSCVAVESTRHSADSVHTKRGRCLNLLLLLPLVAGVAVGARRASGPWHHALLAAALWGAGLGALVGLVLAFQAAHVAVLRTVWNSGLVGAIEAVLAAGLVLLVRFSVRYLR